MNKSAFTLVELLISTTILVLIMIMFGVAVKQTILYISNNQQQISLLNESEFINQELHTFFQKENLKIIQPATLTSTGVHSIKDTLVSAQNPLYKDVVVLTDGTDIFAISAVDKKTHAFLPIESDADWLFAITTVQSNTLADFKEESFHEYINKNLNITSLHFSLIQTGSLLRIDYTFDNNLYGYFDKNKQDEYYLTGASHIIKKIDL